MFIKKIITKKKTQRRYVTGVTVLLLVVAVLHALRLFAGWEGLKEHLVFELDPQGEIFEGVHFREARFASWLANQGIAWPRLKSGRLALDDKTFRGQCRRFPKVEPYRQLRSLLSKLRLNKLSVGADGRNRCLLSPFSSRTGRNQPSNSRFIFGVASWLRGLVQPPPVAR